MDIEIRRLNLNDIDSLFEAATESIVEAYPWLPWCHPNYSKQETIEWVTTQISAWESGEEYSFAIVEKATGRFLGGVGLNFINRMHKTCNLGYWVRSSCTSKGVATKAAILAAHFAFEKVEMNRVEIVMSEKNIASKRVAQKTGAKLECLARKKLLIHNIPTNSFVFSLVKEDLDG